MTKFKPDFESLKEHPLPDWYDDAKLGIFIHWGLYSVPAWAPTTGELGAVDWDVWFKSNPYAEWYQNTLRIEDSETRKYHNQKYGPGFKYEDFAKSWKAEKWDPDKWAALFKKIGARYVVLTTKHHDGFNLWPSKYTDFSVKKMGPERDLVGDLTEAVRKKGLKMGLYYSGLLDWRFTKEPITDPGELTYNYPQTYEYVDYSFNQWMELIEKYQPAVLWNDIGWPKKGVDHLKALFAHYYNQIPDGVINDRWLTEKFAPVSEDSPFGLDWTDYQTAEYELGKIKGIAPHKWEMCRGLSFSFGFNQNEADDQTLSSAELIKMFVDIVSRNGNLLINIGPKADGTIPEIQVERLETLGEWLEINGKAIFGSRPWLRAEGSTRNELELRFTKNNGNLYITLFGKPADRDLVIKSVMAEVDSTISILGINEKLTWEQKGSDLIVNLPERLPSSPVDIYTLEISPAAANIVRN